MGSRSPNSVQLTGDAFELIFHPPRSTLIPHIKEGYVIWQEKEPRLTFVDSTWMNLSPSYRDLIYKLPQTDSPRFSLKSLQEQQKTLPQFTTYPRKTVIASSIQPHHKMMGFSASDYKVNGAIAREASETYRMRILTDPFSFIFPREEYGRVDVDRAVLIGER